MSFKKTSLQDAFDMEIQRHKDDENWTHATPNAQEFKDTLAKRVMIMCRQCSVAGRRVPPPKWYNIIFEGHEDRCGDDEENPSEESDDGVIDVEDATGDEEGANKKTEGQLDGQKPPSSNKAYRFKYWPEHKMVTRQPLFGGGGGEERTHDIRAAEDDLAPATAHWPDGHTFVVENLLSVTVKAWSEEPEKRSCAVVHWQGRSCTDAPIIVKTAPQAQRLPIVVIYVSNKQKCMVNIDDLAEEDAASIMVTVANIFSQWIR